MELVLSGVDLNQDFAELPFHRSPSFRTCRPLLFLPREPSIAVSTSVEDGEDDPREGTPLHDSLALELS